MSHIYKTLFIYKKNKIYAITLTQVSVKDTQPHPC